MDGQLREDIVNFIYRFETLDHNDIKIAIPEASTLSERELDAVIQEDYEKMNREIEYATYDYSENWD